MQSLKQAFSFFKKLFIFFIVISVLLLTFYNSNTNDRKKINYNSAVENNQAQIKAFINDKELNSTKNGRAIVFLYRNVACSVVGEACFTNNKQENFDKSTFGFLTNLLSFPTSRPPASGIYWAYSSLQKSNLVSSAYASEGIGFAAIQGYENLWKIFRDLAYVVLVLVIVIIGFLIMFRVKINPQTVISLENALPRIIVTLLLITFSYAIAGFLIDLMYFIIALAITQLTHLNAPGYTPADTVSLLDKYSSAQFGDLFSRPDSMYKTGASFLSVLPVFIKNVISTFFTFIGTTYLVKFIMSDNYDRIATSFSNATGGAGASFLGIGGNVMIGIGLLPTWLNIALASVLFATLWHFIGPLLIGLLIFFTVVFLVFRIFFILMKTYLTILLLIIFAPFYLLLNAIPGRNAFSKWFRSLSVNLAIFPLVIILIMVANILGDTNVNGSPTWQPPFLYGLDSDAFATLLALGMLLLIPDLIKAFKASMGIKESPIKFGFGTFFGGISGAGASATGSLAKYSSVAFGLQQLRQSSIGSSLFGKSNKPAPAHPPPHP